MKVTYADHQSQVIRGCVPWVAAAKAAFMEILETWTRAEREGGRRERARECTGGAPQPPSLRICVILGA